jgi:hypothetical protein
MRHKNNRSLTVQCGDKTFATAVFSAMKMNNWRSEDASHPKARLIAISKFDTDSFPVRVRRLRLAQAHSPDASSADAGPEPLQQGRIAEDEGLPDVVSNRFSLLPASRPPSATSL